MAGIYLHIPFCKQACIYCNFHFSTSLKFKKDVLAAMDTELKLQKDFLGNESIDSIYLGGGTPSLLTGDEIKFLTDTIYKYYPIGELKEVTIECNPDDISHKYLIELRATAITRLSIGIQSFEKKDLMFLKRAHDEKQAEYAVKASQDAGFENMSIDLIYGLPTVEPINEPYLASKNSWFGNLAKVKEFDIPHFSAYALTVENKTALHHAIVTKKLPELDSELAAIQFEQLVKWAKVVGYDHYEISNFALPGKHAYHNTNYWLGVKYLGIGPSAHSYNGTSRFWNTANNAQYIRGLTIDNQLIRETETLSQAQQINEYIMLSLRTMWGCDLDKVMVKWDKGVVVTIEKNAEHFIKKDWIEKGGNTLILTEKGKLFADKIAAELFV